MENCNNNLAYVFLVGIILGAVLGIVLLLSLLGAR